MRLNAITPRELAVLDGVSEGLMNFEIAEELSIATCTVESHVAQLRLKLGARNRTHAVALAYHHGLLIAPRAEGTGRC